MKKRLTVCIFLALPLAVSAAPPLLPDTARREWRSYGGNPGGTRYSPLDQINRSNVRQLKSAWTFRTGELELMKESSPGRWPPFECTPLMVGDVLYLSTPSGRVIALEATSGRQLWDFDPQPGSGSRRRFDAHRGVAYWEAPQPATQVSEGRIFSGTGDGRLICLNAQDGIPCQDFGDGGMVDLNARFRTGNDERLRHGITSPPAIYRDLVITGSQVPEEYSRGPSGDVFAFNVHSGELVWRFHTVPRPGETGHDTWEGESWKDRSGVNVWSVMSVDVERGLVFLPLGSAAYDFYGADRKGANLFANSVVALQADTGAYLWHFQSVHHDIWDYDLPAQPNLVTVTHDGREIQAVAQVSKMGFVFLLDRSSGKPLFPVEERPVPPSDVPGEATFLTQPFPLKPPPLSRQSAISASDLHELTPGTAEFCRNMFEQAVRTGGVYEPAGLGLTLSFPGTLGGATWSGASFDPQLGYLFVNVNEVGRIGLMAAEPEGSGQAYWRRSPWGSYARFWEPQTGWPCQKPPWGTLHAVDLNSGTIAWSVPLGELEALNRLGVPPTGAPNLGGTIATAGGLVFVGGSSDRRFRAFDSKTGEELWSAGLEASGHATPATYAGRDGRQYVVIAAGGGGYFSQDLVSDVLTAFALAN